MRTPDHLAVKDACRKAIPAIFHSMGFSTPSEIAVDKQGWVNPCFFVDSEYVIRFNARDAHLPKFQRERLVFERLGSLGFPVPECIGFDDSRTFAPYDFMICKRIQGQNLEAHWSSLDASVKTVLSVRAGKLLAEIHTVKFDFFGELSGRGPFPQTSTWVEYLTTRLEYNLLEARGLQVFTADQEKAFRYAFAETLPLIRQVSSSSLIHGDFHLGNLLYVGDAITAVLDFEWSCAGDPLFDIASLRTMDKTWADSQVGFNQGYGVGSFTAEALAKMRVYNMIQNTELCIVAKKYFSEAELADFISVTIDGF